MEKKITIVIQGLSASGKTTIGRWIFNSLSGMGFSSSLTDTEDGITLTPDRIEKQLNALSKLTEVEIKTVQLNRNGKLIAPVCRRIPKARIPKAKLKRLLRQAISNLLDHPTAQRHVTVGNRYRLADVSEDIVNAIIKKEFK